MSRRLVLAVSFVLGCGCQPAPPLPATYENVAAVMDASCSFRSCHGGTGAGAARLNFDTATERGISYDRLMVSVDSCMYDAMPLVDPYHPENSWLMEKIAGPHSTGSALDFRPRPEDGWEHGLTPRPDGTLPSSVCPLTVRGALSFGTIMPNGSSRGLDAARVDLIRRWILAGAPGPDGTVGPRDGGPDARVIRDAPPIDAPRDADLDAPSEDAEAMDVTSIEDAPSADDAPGEEDAPVDEDAPADEDAGELDADLDADLDAP